MNILKHKRSRLLIEKLKKLTTGSTKDMKRFGCEWSKRVKSWACDIQNHTSLGKVHMIVQVILSAMMILLYCGKEAFAQEYLQTKRELTAAITTEWISFVEQLFDEIERRSKSASMATAPIFGMSHGIDNLVALLHDTDQKQKCQELRKVVVDECVASVSNRYDNRLYKLAVSYKQVD